MNGQWIDIRRSILFFIARYSICHLDESEPNTRSWRPNILVLSNALTERLLLIELAKAFTHRKGLMVVVSIIIQGTVPEVRRENIKKSIKEFLHKRRIDALIEIIAADSIFTGIKELAVSYGLGPLAPNTFLFGETKRRENFVQFANLFKYIYQVKRNMVVVRQGQAFLKAGRAGKRIIVWWGGKRENISLMLTLVYMLQSSPEWRKARLTLRTIVKREEEVEKTRQYLKNLMAEGRITDEFEVLVNNSHKDLIPTTIRRFSQEADLVFMGIRPPESDESDHDYGAYYEGLIKSTEQFPPLVLVLAAKKT